MTRRMIQWFSCKISGPIPKFGGQSEAVSERFDAIQNINEFTLHKICTCLLLKVSPLASNFLICTTQLSLQQEIKDMNLQWKRIRYNSNDTGEIFCLFNLADVLKIQYNPTFLFVWKKCPYISKKRKRKSCLKISDTAMTFIRWFFTLKSAMYYSVKYKVIIKELPRYMNP